jgi:hypothetical protein
MPTEELRLSVFGKQGVETVEAVPSRLLIRSGPSIALKGMGCHRNAIRHANGAIVKHWFCCALVLAVLSFLFSITPAVCQEIVSSPASDNAAIPDTPSVTQATTCTGRNGKPCPEWVHKLIGQYPPLPESATTQLKRDPSSVHFWTYRGWQEPPLRTNKEVFRSKLFVATHVGGAVAMIVACRNKRSHAQWHSEVPAVAGMFGMDYIQFRFVGGPNAIGPPIYEMVHYGLASTR